MPREAPSYALRGDTHSIAGNRAARCTAAGLQSLLASVRGALASCKVEQPSRPPVPARLPPPPEHCEGNALALAAPSLRVKREAIG